MSQVPFFGVMLNEDGTHTDLASGSTITEKQIKVNRTPFYGRFIDKDGVEHDLRDLIGSGGGGSVDPALIRRVDNLEIDLANLRAAFEAVPIDTTLRAVLDE